MPLASQVIDPGTSAQGREPSGSTPDALADRYHRQTLLPGVGVDGQARLRAAHAMIVGVGALGCASAELLARAGVGTLTLIDRDVVEPTNLQRQCLFDESDALAGRPKAEAAQARLARVNSGVRVRAVVGDFNHRTAERLLREADAQARSDAGPVGVLIDGTDNVETRFLLNDLSVARAVPFVYGGAVGTRGMQATFVPGRGPCLRCVFEDLPAPGTIETCDTAGVLGAAVAIIGATQAADAMKVLLGRADALSGTLLEFDLWSNQRRRLDLAGARRDDCPCCGQRRFEFLDGTRADAFVKLCGRNSVQLMPAAWSQGDAPARVDLAALAERLRPHGRVERQPSLVRVVLASSSRETTPAACDAPEAGDPRGAERPDSADDSDITSADAPRAPLELTVFLDGRAVVKGTTRPEVARAVYARYVGA